MQTQLEKDLIATRDLIAEPSKWVQLQTSTDEDQYCIDGAAAKVTGVLEEFTGGILPDEAGRFAAVMNALWATMPDNVRFGILAHLAKEHGRDVLWGTAVLLAAYNDTKGRQHRDILAMVDRAIAIEQAKRRPPKARIRYDTTEAIAELRRKAQGAELARCDNVPIHAEEVRKEVRA